MKEMRATLTIDQRTFGLGKDGELYRLMPGGVLSRNRWHKIGRNGQAADVLIHFESLVHTLAPWERTS